MLTRLWLACNFTSQIYRDTLKLIWAVSLKLQINSYLTWQQFFGRCRTVSYFKLTSSLCRVYGSMLSSDPFLTWQRIFGLLSYYVMPEAYAGQTACGWPVFDFHFRLTYRAGAPNCIPVRTPYLLRQSPLCEFSGFSRMPDIIHIWLAVWNNPA